MKQQQHHSIFEDTTAMFTASLFVSLGIYLFNICGFITGGFAGLSLILSQLSAFSFGQIFFVLNLPFYLIAWFKMGRRFTVNSFISVGLVSVMADNLGTVITIDNVNPYYAAIIGGLLMGIGLLIMFRHVSSLGGLGVAAKYLQDKRIFNAGRFMMSFDILMLLIGFWVINWKLLLLSILGAVCMNLLIMINHKPGRYQIT